MTRPAPTVLLVEDAPSLRTIYRSVLGAAGFSVHLASTAAEGLAAFHRHRPNIVLLDLALPDRDGLSLMREILALTPDVCIITMTTDTSVTLAVEAMRAGAYDFLVKPFEDDRFLSAVQSANAEMESATRAPPPRRRIAGSAEQAAFIGSSPAMARVQAILGQAARSMATIFITGESGTGKELAALAVHGRSHRAAGPFIALNCGAIPPDLLESEVFGHMKGSFTGAITDKPGAAAAADGGTLFLDEICEMAPHLQTKLLRFLQTSTIQPVGAVRTRKVDVRIICATNRNPIEQVRRGLFREDLYYRLYVVPIDMPPLRARGADVIEIAEAALRRFSAEEGKTFTGFSADTKAELLSQSWPGNVRQLLNVIRNVVVLHDGGLVTPEMLPSSLTAETSPPRSPHPAPTTGQTLAQIEREAIEQALARHGGSVPLAARELDVSPSTLYRKLEGWGMRRA
ncbi:sigma-54 dependent transcriptional regulator [Xinfangfangia sp. CPCC 101601]|uniref:Sigma-54 dependent transcriptional regulator n=1 Tax=Pseudogemmobacter lacusdianii TaxID=3069608 RepID=A0ABU0VU44_9RHOB|nr:sigma-54 dependent transcriptional regulator [Xinfangfangia sp. CPCC 101601]MDQ2064780.1 sigma-54 dependent transcriptional regulator [Xinfangfangia sp. CPCC 101601]